MAGNIKSQLDFKNTMARFNFYNTQRWRELRQFIINRDGGLCVYCGGKGDTAHHKIWVNTENFSNPAVVWNPDNLECVCRDCHAKIHADSRVTMPGLIFDHNGNLIEVSKATK